MVLSRIDPLVPDHDEAAIPGNSERISRIVRRHSNVRRHLTPLPYLRAWQRLRRALQERRHTVARGGKALLDTIYSPRLRADSV
jgi:hypothetical protein